MSLININQQDKCSISQRAKIDLNCHSILITKQSVMSQYKSLWLFVDNSAYMSQDESKCFVKQSPAVDFRKSQDLSYLELGRVTRPYLGLTLRSACHSAGLGLVLNHKINPQEEFCEIDSRCSNDLSPKPCSLANCPPNLSPVISSDISR